MMAVSVDLFKARTPHSNHAQTLLQYRLVYEFLRTYLCSKFLKLTVQLILSDKTCFASSIPQEQLKTSHPDAILMQRSRNRDRGS